MTEQEQNQYLFGLAKKAISFLRNQENLRTRLRGTRRFYGE